MIGIIILELNQAENSNFEHNPQYQTGIQP
jgi:hypothetical protein